MIFQRERDGLGIQKPQTPDSQKVVNRLQHAHNSHREVRSRGW